MLLTSAAENLPGIGPPGAYPGNIEWARKGCHLKCQKNQMRPVVPHLLSTAVDNESSVWNRQLVLIFETLVEALDQTHQA